jgi:hypothetical protein
VNPTTPNRASPPRAGARLRTIGVLVLLLGLGGAGLRYGTGVPARDLPDDVPTARTSKKAARDVEINFGKMGLWASNLSDDFQDPPTQAFVIAVASILVAAGCFYIAHLQDRADESNNPIV